MSCWRIGKKNRRKERIVKVIQMQDVPIVQVPVPLLAKVVVKVLVEPNVPLIARIPV